MKLGESTLKRFLLALTESSRVSGKSKFRWPIHWNSHLSIWFEEFLCGSWLKAHPLNSESDKFDVQALIRRREHCSTFIFIAASAINGHIAAQRIFRVF